MRGHEQTTDQRVLVNIDRVQAICSDRRSDEEIQKQTTFVHSLGTKNVHSFNIIEAVKNESKPSTSSSSFSPFSRKNLSYHNPTKGWTCNFTDNAFSEESSTPRLFDITTIAVITIHGAAYDGSEWFRLEEAFGDRTIRWVNFTLPGFDNLDERRGSNYTGGVASTCELINDLLEHLNIPRVIILGHSFGGFIRNYFSLLYPAKVLAMGSIATHTLNWNVALRSWYELLMSPGNIEALSLEEFKKKLNDDKERQSLCEGTLAAFEYLRNHTNVQMRDIEFFKILALIKYMNSQEHVLSPIETYGQINPNIPTFVVFGKDDPLIQDTKTTETQYYYLNHPLRIKQQLEQTKEVKDILAGFDFDFSKSVFFDNFLFALERCKHTPHANNARQLAPALRAFVQIIAYLDLKNGLKHLSTKPSL